MKRLSLFVMLMLVPLMGWAQIINVHLKNGTVHKYNSAEVDYIDFTEGSSQQDHSDSGEDKQTIIVFMPWSGTSSSSGLYPFMEKNIDTICRAIEVDKGMKDSRLMLFLSESYNTSALYEVVFNSAKSSCERNVVKKYSGQSYTTSAGLTEILSDVRNHTHSLKYSLIVGCHGTGWTFKDSWRNYPYYAKSTGLPGERRQAERVPYQEYDGELTFKHTRFIGSVSDIATYSINIPDIAQAIADADMKMQYILFDDCYMANVEVAYELRNVTNFLLASTSEVMAIGIPYRTMWKSLSSATPDYASLISEFDSFYNEYVMPYGTFSAIDCSKMDELAAAMRDINASNTLPENVRSEIQVLDGFDEPIFYDMGDYLKYLCADTYGYLRVMAILEDAVESKCNTETIYSYVYGYEKFVKVNTFSGITISDPSINSVAMDGKEKTSWWKATH